MKNLILLTSLIFILGCNSNVSNKSSLSEMESLLLKSSLVDLNNKKVDIKFLKGNKVILNYWATWCKPCIKEMPSLVRAQKKLKNYNYQVILISDENLEKITKFQSKSKYDLNFIKSVKSNELVGVYSLPTTHIFNEKGNKIETIVGTIAWDSDKIINKLKTL
jgi:thiol-disulfide isomerase/thioredoxin